MSDYVFFKASPGDRVVLACVAKTAWQGASLPGDVLELTEYEHTPQPGWPGFFGTFTAKENPEYDAKTSGSRKYVRHVDAPYSAILVFNVGVSIEGEGGWHTSPQSAHSCIESPVRGGTRIPTSQRRATNAHRSEGWSATQKAQQQQQGAGWGCTVCST